MSTLIHSAEFSRPVRSLLQPPKFMNLLMYPREQAWSPGLHFVRNFGSFGALEYGGKPIIN